MSHVAQQKMAEYIGVSNAALEKAAAAETLREKQASQVAALLPGCVAALIAHERIDPVHEKQAYALLRDPVQCLQFLTKLASHRNTAEQQHLGTPTATAVGGNEKTAAAGTDAGSKLRPSDQKLWSGLGLAVPRE